MRSEKLLQYFAERSVTFYSIAASLIAAVLLLNISIFTQQWNDLRVEVFGFFLDILLFGVLFAVYDRWRERRVRVRTYHEQLRDYLRWTGEEGVLRKIGIIRRLNDLSASLPSIESIILDGADLRDAKLMGANLSMARFKGAVLIDSCFDGALLRSARFDAAIMHKASFKDADLSGANLRSVQAYDVDFRGANLTGVDLTEAELCGAKLEGAILEGACLEGANLSQVTGLSTAQTQSAFADARTVWPEGARE